MVNLLKFFKVSVKVKRKSETDFTCRSGCKEYLSSTVFPQLLRRVKKVRGVSYTRAKLPPTQENYKSLVDQHFTPNENYMFVLNADPYVYHGYKNESVKKKYKLYLYAIKKALRGKPYKKANYQVYPEFGDKNAKFHVNLLINLKYYPYVKSLCHDIRKSLTNSDTRYPKYSCTLPRTYGRKPNYYACKDARYMYILGYHPYIGKNIK